MKDLLVQSKRIGALLMICALIGCGDEPPVQPRRDAGTDTAPDTAPDVAADSTEPEFRDVRISIGGEFSAEIDLRDEDESQILPATAPAAFKLFLRDDTTASEELVVEIIDAEGNPLAPTDGPTFRNGLWHVEVELAPGVTARPKVTDAAGNEAVHDAALVIPSRAEAVTDQWRTLLYNDQFEVEERWLATFGADHTWEESRDVDGGWSRGGEFEFDQGQLAVTQTWGPDDSDESSAEWRETGEYYVDETYFARQPLGREETGDGLVGSWAYTYERFEASGTDLESQGPHTIAIRFNDDGTWEETLSAPDVGLGQSRSGTWTVETNAGYAANFGDFLVRTTTHEDGEALETPVETTELFVIQLDHLLISPRIRGHD